MITATAPASSAFCAFWPKSQVPRWTTAIAPSGKPAKSAASQPDVLLPAGPGGSTTSTSTSSPVTSSPDPEKSARA